MVEHCASYIVGRTRTSGVGSSHQSTKWEKSFCRTCVLIVIVSRSRTAFDGSLLGTDGSNAIGGVKFVASRS